MTPRRVLAAVVGALVLGSVAAAVVWQAASEPGTAQSADAGDAVPASRSMFPKVLNH